MKKILFTALLFFLFSTTTQAFASMAEPEPSYSSSVQAELSAWGPNLQEMLTDSSTAYVEIYRTYEGMEMSEYRAAARVDGFEAGAAAFATSESLGDAMLSATASYRQQFRITAAGSASIAFSINGTMALWTTGSAEGGVYYSGTVSESKSLDTISFGTGYSNNSGQETSYSRTFSRSQALEWDFGESDIGSLFFIDVSLETFAWGMVQQDGPMDGNGEGELDDPPLPGLFMATSDFMNSLTLDEISGGIVAVSAVPVPATAWLLLTGLAGLMGVGRKRLK